MRRAASRTDVAASVAVQRIVVGSRVEVRSVGAGMVAMDNEDGTWNVDLDDGQEGDFSAEELVLTADQSLDELRRPVHADADAAPYRELPGIRVVSFPWSEPKPEGWVRFVCFSDTHGLHDNIPSEHRPEADVLLHAGDFTNTGELEQVESLSQWLQVRDDTDTTPLAAVHILQPHYFPPSLDYSHTTTRHMPHATSRA